MFEPILTFLFFGILIYSFAYLFFEYLKERKHLECLVYITLWGGGFLIASLYAIRFSIFLVTPVSLLFSIFLSKIWDFVKIDLSDDK
jgi:asparagine N-glycosylation enzyme membrane subunit Stt3